VSSSVAKKCCVGVEKSIEWNRSKPRFIYRLAPFDVNAIVNAISVLAEIHRLHLQDMAVTGRHAETLRAGHCFQVELTCSGSTAGHIR